MKRDEDKERKLQNENCAPKMKGDPMDVHFAMMEQRGTESLRKTDRLKEVSDLILRATYLNERAEFSSYRKAWTSKMTDILRFCLKIHEVHCPLLIECLEDPRMVSTLIE